MHSSVQGPVLAVTVGHKSTGGTPWPDFGVMMGEANCEMRPSEGGARQQRDRVSGRGPARAKSRYERERGSLEELNGTPSGLKD